MILESLSISFALAMDAFAVSVSSGVKLDKVGKREVFRIAWHFGLFQFLFFVGGYLAGSQIYSFIDKWAGLIASFLLFIIGGRMIYESFEKDEDKKFTNPTKGKTLVLLSVATSIDAMAAGFGVSMVDFDIVSGSASVFLVTLLLCCFGILLGDKISGADVVKKGSGVFGGFILILLALKFLIYN